jgi:hypothetical protein
MSDSERILKELGLDIKCLVKDKAYEITPLDFLSKIKIVLVDEEIEFCMFIWKDGAIQKECRFTQVGNITDLYSYLYNYDSKNFKNKTWLKNLNYTKTY